jgi:predicted transcriptional regulator
MLLIAENSADNELALALKNELNTSSQIIDIKPSDDLNSLFIEQEYIQKNSIIIMLTNRISTPFNNTLIDRLETFIDNGGIFGVVSTHIWRFPDSFHELLGYNIPSGQKEWPLGNTSSSITLTIMNDTFCNSPFEFSLNSRIVLEAGIGITSPLQNLYRVAISQNTPNGNTSVNAFKKGSGFVIAAPLSLINNTSIQLSQFLTSLISSGIEVVNDQQPNTSNSISSSIDPPLIPGFSISEESIQLGLGISFFILLIASSIYVIRKWKIKLDDDSIPRDYSYFSLIFLNTFFFIAHVIFPPVLRRLDTYNVYENETRKRIIDILEERNFLHFRELKRELNNIGTSGLRWHLQVLVDFSIIDRQGFKQYEIYYLVTKRPQSSFLEVYFAIISGIGFRVAKAFQETDSWDLSALAIYLETSKESVRYHCKRLEQINLLLLKGNRYFLNNTKKKLLLNAIYQRSKNN